MAFLSQVRCISYRCELCFTELWFTVDRRELFTTSGNESRKLRIFDCIFSIIIDASGWSLSGNSLISSKTSTTFY